MLLVYLVSFIPHFINLKRSVLNSLGGFNGIDYIILCHLMSCTLYIFLSVNVLLRKPTHTFLTSLTLSHIMLQLVLLLLRW
ncbi:hypothetical protein CW304_16385 [Bacillus sp. UFRGS-B20]|nr:hypothetical protein CW304_16385 [Bacillus sp. UFRGS-B20]